MARLRILAVSQPHPVAPAGIWLEAVDVTGFDVASAPGAAYDPSFHGITYRWRVIERPLAPFTAPENMIPDWNDPNLAHGKQVAFFFPDPGRYRIEVEARDARGTTARSEIGIDVADPDQVYAGPRTIAVSFDPAETWAGAPAGSQRAASPADLERALRVSREPARVRFRRGQIYGGIDLRIEGTQLGQLDAWGPGAAPVLRGVDRPLFQLHKRSKVTHLTIADLVFRGDWDPTTETGISTTSPFLWTQSPTPAHYAVWNCHFEGFDHIDVEVRDLPSTMLFGNSTVTNWRNFGFLMRSANARFALVGMCIAQHEEALHGGPKSGHLSNTHGPVRVPDCARVYIGTSDFFSRTGWSGLAGELADQPCLRLNTTGAPGSAFNLDRIVCEGGIHQINLKGSNPRTEENPGNYLIDRALFIGTAKTIGPFVAVDFGGLTMRNALGILPNAPRRHPNRWQGALRTKMENPAPGNTEAPLALYSSTFLNLLEPENDTGKAWQLHGGGDAFRNATYENNILHDAPRSNGGVVFDGTLPGIRPRFRGVRYNFRNQRGKLGSAIAPGQGLVIPYRDITRAFPGMEEAPATDQAYWQETEATDRWHMLAVRGVRSTLYAALGHIEVRFAPEGAIVINRTKVTWKAGAKYELRLDRSSRLARADRRYGSPDSLPLPLPDPKAPAFQGATQGMVTRDDFFLRPRGATPSQGAIEPR